MAARSFLSALPLALCPLATAQAGSFTEAGPGTEAVPVTDVRALPPITYDLATGNYSVAPATRIGGAVNVAVPCYANTVTSGLASVVPAGEEWVDWGDKGCALTGFLAGFTCGYSTTAVDSLFGGPGASLDLAVFQDTTGAGTLGTEIARVRLSGLPGSVDGVTPGAFTVHVTFTTPPRLCDGDIGWSYVGVDGVTGPLLVPTAGVCFSSTDPGTGTADCFDTYAAPAMPASYLGTFGFMTAGIASFYIALDEFDGSSSTSSVINGSGVNPVLFSEAATARPNTTWSATIDLSGHPGALATAVVISDDAFPPVLITAGEVLVNIAPPSLFFIDIAFGSHTAQVPKAPGLLGDDIVTQGAIFDPSSGGLVLLNGITFTLGL